MRLSSWQISNTIKLPAQGSTTRSFSLVVAVIKAFVNSLGFWWGCFRLLGEIVASSQTFPNERFLNTFPFWGCFCNRKQNSALERNQLPSPKKFFLCQTKQSTIFKAGVFNSHKGTRSLPNKVLFTHNRQNAEGLRILAGNFLGYSEY